jgi:hypothetical protein
MTGEREVVAVVNGEETRYLAPARTEEELQAQIDAHLARAPGGVQINENEISYDGGRFIMTFAKPGQQVGTDPTVQASSDCTFAWYCFYDGINFTYPRGRFSDCGWQDMSAWGWHDRTESVAQNLLGTWIQYLNHTTGGHGNDVHLFFTDTLFEEIPDVAPYRNMADHGVRHC